MISLALFVALAMPGPGLQPGDTLAAFEPYHVTGPYAETTNCPICEWGIGPMVIVWTQMKDPESLRKVVSLINVTVTPMTRVRAILVDANLAGDDTASRAGLASFYEPFKPQKVFFLSRMANLRKSLEDFKLLDTKKWETIIYVSNNRSVLQSFVNPKAQDEAKLVETIRRLG